MSIEQIESNLKKVLTDLVSSKVKNSLETEAVKSVMRNFEQGGRPAQWKPSTKSKKNAGTKTLVVSGNMSQIASSTEQMTNGFRIVLMPGPKAKAYSRIQHEGGVINMPARNIRFRAGAAGTVFAKNKHKRITKETMGRAHSITIPPRPYLLIPESDYGLILDNIIKNLNIS